MPLPYPLPDDPRKWTGWTSYNSKNLYERLGLTYEESPSAHLIEESCRQLLLWWQKKLPLKSQTSNPLSQLLGKAIDDAPRMITEAKVVLLDPEKRTEHDSKLSSLQIERGIEELKKFANFTLAKKQLTASDEDNLMGMGRQMGLSDEVILRLIESQLEATGSIRVENAPPAPPPPPPAPVVSTPSTSSSSGGEAGTAMPPDDEGFTRFVQTWKERSDFGELEDEDKEMLKGYAANFRLSPEWAEAIIEGREYDPNAQTKKEEKKKTPQIGKKAAEAVPKPAAVAPIQFNPDQERRDYAPFTNSLDMPMVYIPGGSFQLGSTDAEAHENEGPVSQCSVTGFYMSKYLIPNILYEQFDPSHVTKRGPWADDTHPVVFVSHIDAEKFCDWLSKAEGKKYRLPTEAEWEYAAKGTDGRKYPWGNHPNDGRLSNFADAKTQFPWSDHDVDDGYEQSSPVGAFMLGASPFGIEDMAGNVWEWCQDAFGPYKSAASVNPMNKTGNQKVVRGGSWRSRMNTQRTSARGFQLPNYFANDIGFRIVCERPKK